MPLPSPTPYLISRPEGGFRADQTNSGAQALSGPVDCCVSLTPSPCCMMKISEFQLGLITITAVSPPCSSAMGTWSKEINSISLSHTVAVGRVVGFGFRGKLTPARCSCLQWLVYLSDLSCRICHGCRTYLVGIALSVLFAGQINSCPL